MLITVLLLLVAATIALATPPPVRFAADTRSGHAAAERCAEIWREEGPALAARLLPVGTRVDTITCLLLSPDAFAARFTGSVPDWGVGVAVGGGRLVAIDHARLPAVGRGLREVFLHEMTHSLLFQAAPEVWMPAWFHEGCAMRLAGEWRFVDTVSLALEGRVPALDRLQGRFPRVAATADRAYRTSLLAVNWLTDRHGPDAVPRVVAAAARRGDFHAGFQDATGESVAEYSAAFASRMRLRFGWLVMATRWPGLFVLLALVLLVGGLRKIVLARRRLAEMDDDEAREFD
ncbi:MAG: hypothetical protein GY838_20020 [bacterium]|nr:hypothetical protein [bacterium]